MTLWRLVVGVQGENNLFLSPCKESLLTWRTSEILPWISARKNAKETRFSAVCCQRYPRISTPSTPHREEFSAPLQSTAPPLPNPPPPGQSRLYSRWPCHSRPCVPSEILLRPQLSAPKVTIDAFGNFPTTVSPSRPAHSEWSEPRLHLLLRGAGAAGRLVGQWDYFFFGPSLKDWETTCLAVPHGGWLFPLGLLMEADVGLITPTTTTPTTGHGVSNWCLE